MPDQIDWHGWRVGETSVHIGELPGRKQVVLYEMRNGGRVIHPLAYFKTTEDAQSCLNFLDKLADAG